MAALTPAALCSVASANCTEQGRAIVTEQGAAECGGGGGGGSQLLKHSSFQCIFDAVIFQ